MGIIYHEWAPQTIAVLCGEMAVVPISTYATDMSIRVYSKPQRIQLTGLIRHLEVVEERVPAANRTLVDERWTVGPVRALLEKAMPVLGKPVS